MIVVTPRGKANSWRVEELEQFALRWILININEPLNDLKQIQLDESFYVFLK